MIDSNETLKKVISSITDELDDIGETTLANEFRKWGKTFFTTSTEFLGELKLVLEKTKNVNALGDHTKAIVEDCICDINKVLGS